MHTPTYAHTCAETDAHTRAHTPTHTQTHTHTPTHTLGVPHDMRLFRPQVKAAACDGAEHGYSCSLWLVFHTILQARFTGRAMR